MLTRIFLGTSMLAFVGALFALDCLFSTRLLASSLVFGLGLAGWWELSRLSGIHSRARGGGAGLFLVGLLGTAYFLALAWWQAAAQREAPLLLESGIVGSLFCAFVYALFRDDHQQSFQPIMVTILGVLLLGFLFSYLLKVYHLKEGTFLGVVFLLGVKGNDIAAYFVGRALGRTHFLKVSPNKTLEGCAAAIIFSALWFGAVLAGWPKAFFPWPKAILLGIILSVTSQVGDLTESLIKRFYQVKDSSSLFPEFGGVLDLIDSALFSGFLFWIVCRF